MPTRCFLLEPIFDDLAELVEDYGQRERRPIKGWRRTDTGEEKQNISEFGVGAMWFVDWWGKSPHWDDQEGPPLAVATPGGDWLIDSRCSNCTMPNDRAHRCWVRHGDPPDVTVDKNGKTCGAGAGSIMIGKYHGFLRGGELTD